jgi:hypothetical protein
VVLEAKNFICEHKYKNLSNVNPYCWRGGSDASLTKIPWNFGGFGLTIGPGTVVVSGFINGLSKLSGTEQFNGEGAWLL